MVASRLRLIAVAAGAAAALVVLLAARPRLAGPVTSWTGDELALATAWACAVACSAWITVVALACNVALGARRPRLAAALARGAPGFVRRAAGLAIVGSTVVATALPGALPATAATRDQPVVRAPAPVAAGPHRPPPVRVPAPPPPPARPARHTHVVRAGDNLWRIARDELVARGTRHPDDRVVARYWRTVIAVNRATLRSHDANLIFAGEIITLPEPD